MNKLLSTREQIMLDALKSIYNNDDLARQMRATASVALRKVEELKAVPEPTDVEKTATLSLTLAADSGYTCEQVSKISVNQWTRISAILAEA